MELKPQNDWLSLTRDCKSKLWIELVDQIMQVRVNPSSVKPTIITPLFCKRIYRSVNL